MINHEKPFEYVIDRVRFSHNRDQFSGRGLLSWDPEKGIHVQAFLDKSAPNSNRFAAIGHVEIQNSSDAHTVRLAIRGLGHALVPNVFPSSLSRYLDEGRLSIRPQRVIFFRHYPAEFFGKYSDNQFWGGSADFITESEPEFPDDLKTETTLNGQTIQTQNKGGLCYDETSGLSVWGHRTENGLFRTSWALPKALSTKTEAWVWAEAARRALSILFAQTIWIRCISVTRGNTQIAELRRPEKVHPLDHYQQPLTDFGSPDQSKFNRTAFIQLTRFFASNSPHREICWNIFRRLAEASRQETWESRELLTGTAMEAALRTLDNHPFKPGDHTWKVKQSLESFRQTYLDSNWEQTCTKALEVRERLRHRNAHPDWVTNIGGSFSKPEWRQSIEDLTFLSRFYGYMILALAGFKPLQPRFPKLQFK